MYTSQNDTSRHNSAAKELGDSIREARKRQGLTIAELADRIGRPREWLNRLELGYSEYGIHAPASASDLQNLISVLHQHLHIAPAELLAIGLRAEEDFNLQRHNARSRSRNPIGKLTHIEIIMGEPQVAQAIQDLIAQQHSDAIIRNTGVKNIDSYSRSTIQREQYGEALGRFLSDNPNALFKRVEYVPSAKHLEIARQSDSRLCGTKDLADVHNAKVKFRKANPFHLHVLIGQREAILTFPQSTAQSGSSIALLIRDKLFIEALRTWYDEVLWEGKDPSEMVDFSHFDASFSKISHMYGFSSQS